MISLLKLLDERWMGVELFRCVDERGGCSLSRQQFGVDFNPRKWGRQTCAELETQIENAWQRKMPNPKLFNQSKFRFGGIDSSAKTKIYMNVGLTCYRDIVGTTGRPEEFKYWQERGKQESGNPQIYLSDGLGTGILAFTLDRHLLVLRRAAWTEVYPGLLDRPGGHPEPDNVFPEDNSFLTKGCEDVCVAVANELWQSPIAELEAETGISPRQIEDHKLMGVVANSSLGGRPSTEFYTTVKLSAKEVKRLYSLNRHSEADESTAVELLPPARVRLLLDHIERRAKGLSPDGGEPDDEVAETLRGFTPALIGALALYGALFQGGSA